MRSNVRRCGFAGPPRAFTLMELLVVMAILGLLLAILLPALVAVRQEAKAFVCMDHGRAAAIEFRMFADPHIHLDRGDSQQFGARFDAVDYLESLYEIDEFWPSAAPGTREAYRRGQKPIICPSGPYGLERIKRPAPGSTQGRAIIDVAPLEKVSYAMNRRLYMVPASELDRPVEIPVRVHESIQDNPHVPLLFDVDAPAAIASGNPALTRLPFFSAPDYGSHNYWFPDMRHRGRVTVSFIGGHVLSSSDPLGNSEWDWDYHPPVD